jgi:hypothetical protein
MAAATLLLIAAWPDRAEAQRHGQRGWAPYPYGYYPYGALDQLSSTLHLEVEPREAKVFVDGYSAGIVDDFDGLFQRLRVEPGGHEITFYLEGYRTIRQTVYLSPGDGRALRFRMDRLPDGETAEPPPDPQPQTAGPPQGGPPYEPERRPRAPEPAQAFGTLSLRVQPADAEILVDGEPWKAPEGQDRVGIRLAAGEHRIEVSKAGFARYTETVLIQRGRTLALNVSLTR